MNDKKQTVPEKKKIILTKKRLAALNTALSIDDILYEKFRRQQEWFDREYQRVIAPKKRVIKVINQKNDGFYVMKIIDVKQTGEGFVVYVED